MTPNEVPAELVELAEVRLIEEYGGHGWPGDVGARELLAEALTRWEEIRPQVCPFDCDGCHSDDCPCDRLGCGGYQRVVLLEHRSGAVTGFVEPGTLD